MHVLMLLLSKNDNEYVPPSISFPAPYYLMLIKEKNTKKVAMSCCYHVSNLISKQCVLVTHNFHSCFYFFIAGLL